MSDSFSEKDTVRIDPVCSNSESTRSDILSETYVGPIPEEPVPTAVATIAKMNDKIEELKAECRRLHKARKEESQTAEEVINHLNETIELYMKRNEQKVSKIAEIIGKIRDVYKQARPYDAATKSEDVGYLCEGIAFELRTKKRLQEDRSTEISQLRFEKESFRDTAHKWREHAQGLEKQIVCIKHRHRQELENLHRHYNDLLDRAAVKSLDKADKSTSASDKSTSTSDKVSSNAS